MKKIIVLAITALLSLSFIFVSSDNTVQAEPIENRIFTSADYYQVEPGFDIVKAKIDLVLAHPFDSSKLDKFKAIEQELYVNQIIDDLSLSESVKEQKLAMLGVYKLDVPYTSLASQPSDVYIGKVSIYYNTYSTHWILYSSGYWYDNEVACDDGHSVVNCNEIFWIGGYGAFVSEGERLNVGGRDSVGIFLQDTYGTYSATFESGYGRFYNYDGEYNISYTGSTKDVNPTSRGASYTMQDYLEVTNITTFLGVLTSMEESYLALHFYTRIEYSAAFTTWNGNAVMFYAHTWDETDITGVGLGADSISFSTSTNSEWWQGQSNTDTSF